MEADPRIRKFTRIIIGYPFALLAVSLGVNLAFFRIEPAEMSLPDQDIVWALVAAATLLVVNHSWLMTMTELTRLNHRIFASPEEWASRNARKQDVSERGWVELERLHNAHRNATENTVYFVLLALLVSVMSPSVVAAQTWIIGFAVARLGYTYAALNGKTDLRGLFMSLSLLALYGLGSCAVLGMIYA